MMERDIKTESVSDKVNNAVRTTIGVGMIAAALGVPVGIVVGAIAEGFVIYYTAKQIKSLNSQNRSIS
jgi:ABC-type dipeptide/oligopeptide/nickel transport system permease subunit